MLPRYHYILAFQIIVQHPNLSACVRNLHLLTDTLSQHPTKNYEAIFLVVAAALRADRPGGERASLNLRRMRTAENCVVRRRIRRAVNCVTCAAHAPV
jgi:hypothetical protein